MRHRQTREWLKIIRINRIWGFSFCFQWWWWRTFLDSMGAETSQEKHIHCGWHQSFTWASHLAAWPRAGDFSKFGLLWVFLKTLSDTKVSLTDAKPFLQSTGGKRPFTYRLSDFFMHMFSDFGWHFLKWIQPEAHTQHEEFKSKWLKLGKALNNWKQGLVMGSVRQPQQ